MLDNNDEVLHMIKGSYKKLKTYFYYDKTLLYIKYKIAEFESDRNRFETILNELSENIVKNDVCYFDNLISEIEFKVMPKRLTSVIENTDVIKSGIDDCKNIQKINFYIDLPIQLYIVDFLWMLLIGKIALDNTDFLKYSYATKFKKSLYNKNSLNLYKGLDFDSNRCFEPYFNLYSSWRDNAFDTIQEMHINKDTILINLDLKSFYYSVQFEFSKLNSYLKNDTRLNDIIILTKIIEKIYCKYTLLISKYKKGIDKNTTVFPIGLASPIVLRELYLEEFDKSIVQKTNSFYYGRYVDDILFVLDGSGKEKFNTQSIIENELIRKEIIIPSENNNLSFYNYKNLKIQKDKINVFFFQKNQKDILLDVYDKKIRINSSEANLLPDIGILNKSFNNAAYNIENLEVSNKISDLGFLKSNNYKATKFINGLKKVIKNTNKLNDINIYLDEIISFYKGSQSIEFTNSWRSVFELFVLCGDKKRANIFYNIISEYIKKVSFDSLNQDELYKKQYKYVLKKIKNNLFENLEIAISLAISLDFSMAKKKMHREMALNIRNSNLLDHSLVAVPLINYSSMVNNISLIDMDSINLNYNLKNKFQLDSFMLTWTPRYIYLEDFYIVSFLYQFNNNWEKVRDVNEIYKKFLNFNNLNFIKNNSISESKIGYKVGKITQHIIRLNDHEKPNIKVALVNTNITEGNAIKSLINPKKFLTIRNKQKLFRILNTAKEESADILVFPEFYFPIAWISEITRFAKTNDITIITGLNYLKWENMAYNIVCVIQPTINRFKFRNCILFFREKNFYAPKEKINLSKFGYKCSDSLKPFYYIIEDNFIKFSVVLCFEFTDIESRASMKSKINTLFVPQLNKDTNYFSNIVESASRDLFCYVVQANTANYGDSRITAPFSTDKKILCKLKVD